MVFLTDVPYESYEVMAFNIKLQWGAQIRFHSYFKTSSG